MSNDTVEYEDHVSEELYQEILKEAKAATRQVDRVMVKAMVALVKSGHASFLFLQDDEIRNVWTKMVKKATTAMNKREAAMKTYEIKLGVYNRLSPEERKLLKINRPTKPKV